MIFDWTANWTGDETIAIVPTKKGYLCFRSHEGRYWAEMAGDKEGIFCAPGKMVFRDADEMHDAIAAARGG